MRWRRRKSCPSYSAMAAEVRRLKLLGYLDAPEDIRVAWAEDCWGER